MENSDINHFLSDIPRPVSPNTARENYHFSIIIFFGRGEASPHPFPRQLREHPPNISMSYIQIDSDT